VIDWPEYRDGLAPLRKQLLAEFAERSAQARAQLLAAFDTALGRYELWQAPDAATPELYRTDRTGRHRLIDFAELAGDDAEFLLGDLAISPDGRLLAYTVDPTGADQHRLRVIDLTEPGPERPVRDGLGAPVCWHDGRLVCLELDEAMTPAVAVRLSPTGTSRQELYRAAPGEYLDLSQAADGRTVLITAESHAGSQFLLLAPGESQPVPGRSLPGWPAPDRPDDRVSFDIAAGVGWLLHSPADGPNRLWRRSPDGDWQLAGTASPDGYWAELTALGRDALVLERYAGGQRLQRIRPGAPPVELRFEDHDDDPATLTVLPGTSAEPMVLREGWRAEPRLFRLPGDGRLARPVEPAPPAAAMTVSRLVAPSADGTAIPITLLGPADLAPPWPIVLYGYGAYGVPVDPYYTPFRVSLLDRGVGFAVAHLRGGGELGPAWHRAGQRQQQPRTVQDYLACARHLIAAGWCPPDGLVARCRSAGAAAVGAALNQDPELFAAAVLEVPFVDCLRTLSDPAAALAELEWTEWGDPVHSPDDRARIAAWSPVDNVAPLRYPPMLITAGLADVRVPPDGPRRYAEAVRTRTTSTAPVFLVEQASGHLGFSDVDQDWHGEADLLAFVFDQLGHTERLPGGPS
jgi:oligopeptidase B